jgi:hypothetical protein
MTTLGQTTTPFTGSPRLQRLARPAAAVGGLALATLALHVRDPHVQGSWGVCPSLALFGVYCPGCGGLRAVNNLSNFDLVGAASSNLLFVAFLPLIGWAFAQWFLAAWRREDYSPRWLQTPRFHVTLATLMVVFMVVRNVPFAAWLAP